MRDTYKISLDDQNKLREGLKERSDTEAGRIKHYLSMPDLSRTEGSPIYEMVERVLAQPSFKDFDVIETPEIVPADISFDLFDFPADHPARSKSDTYYVDDKNILRTHTTVMWYYYLQQKEIKEKMARGESVGCFSHGKVYRKDEIDRHHMNVFHQLDGWYLAPKDKETIGETELKEVLSTIARAVFGTNVISRFNPDTFPYTNPSIEMEVDKDGKWVEVLGSGVVKGSVLEKFGIDSSKWTGWAFGFGLERLAIVSMELPDIRLLWSEDERVKKQLKLGQKYKEVSKFPPVVRDISFVVDSDFILNDYFDGIRVVGGDMVEEVELKDKYENAQKFGEGKTSYTFRITYRHLDRTLTNAEVNVLHAKIESVTIEDFDGTIRTV
ncbi:MAG: phenylalanine--tRNA ligase, alpha subunit [Parcubacteria bacterium C7867-005]|nr:MAG: phenylalanine--tRNA ligase, alpha subunit [Parcubacteria bacterium C7867-005]